VDQVVPAELVAPELQEIASFDGEPITYFLYRPVADNPPVRDGGARGPEARFAPRYDPFIIRLVAEGIAVVAPNVRGSAGWGRRFVSLDDRRLRLDSVRDLTAVARIPCGARRRRVTGRGDRRVIRRLHDAGRPGLLPEPVGCGHRHGRHQQPAHILENTSPYRRRFREVEYGFLDTDRDFLIEASPMTHVDQIRAPLMLIHGANDPRVPVSEARQLHGSLVARGVESELLIYDDEGHGLAKRANRLDASPRMLAFLRKNLDV